MPEAVKIAVNGIVGTLFPAVGVITSFQEQIEWHFRMGSLTVGLAVGIFSLCRIIKPKNPK